MIANVVRGGGDVALDRRQHTKLLIIELLDDCNLSCPTCMASSYPGAGNVKDISVIRSMISYAAREIQPDVLMLSGGEPTIHPHLIEAIECAQSSGIKHIGVISNGVALAHDDGLCAAISRCGKNIEVFLQFDSFRKEALEDIRGQDLRHVRLQAVDNLSKYGISTTLICVVKSGVNLDEVGDIINFAVKYPSIAGVTFQPVRDVGRVMNYCHEKNVTTLSDVRSAILGTCDLFKNEDIVPLPSNPENIEIAYVIRDEAGNVVPFTADLFRSGQIAFSSGAHASIADDFLYITPNMIGDENKYSSIFRVAIIAYMDKHSLSEELLDRSCVHFLTQNLEIIPLDTYFIK